MKITYENWKTQSLSISVAQHSINTRLTVRAGHMGISLLVNKKVASARQLHVIFWLLVVNTLLAVQLL